MSSTAAATGREERGELGELRLSTNPPGLWHILSAAGEAGVVWPVIGFSHVSGYSAALKQTQNVV